MFTVRVQFPEPFVIGFGLKAALAPEGSPLTLKLTVPVNPFTAPMVTVE